ncbi:MAG: hypothetical protein ACRDIY_02990 [Chloroflexota bacterium]
MWFESFVLDAVRQIADSCNLYDHGADLKGVRVDPETKEKTEFQFDVAAIRGYQLFGLSCTTAGKNLIDSKRFEAFIRARQLGGDEARVALVCFTDKPESVERQLRSDFADDDGQFRVFGRDHLADLPSSLKQWIETSAKE